LCDRRAAQQKRSGQAAGYNTDPKVSHTNPHAQLTADYKLRAPAIRLDLFY